MHLHKNLQHSHTHKHCTLTHTHKHTLCSHMLHIHSHPAMSPGGKKLKDGSQKQVLLSGTAREGLWQITAGSLPCPDVVSEWIGTLACCVGPSILLAVTGQPCLCASLLVSKLTSWNQQGLCPISFYSRRGSRSLARMPPQPLTCLWPLMEAGGGPSCWASLGRAKRAGWHLALLSLPGAKEQAPKVLGPSLPLATII